MFRLKSLFANYDHINILKRSIIRTSESAFTYMLPGYYTVTSSRRDCDAVITYIVGVNV